MRKNKEIVMFSTPFVGVRGGKNRKSGDNQECLPSSLFSRSFFGKEITSTNSKQTKYK